MNPRVVRSFVAALTGCFVAATAFAQAPLPKPQKQGAVTYLTGGIGDEEVQSIKQSMKDYTAALAFARAGSPNAEYVADVAVTVKDPRGETVFEAPSVGPYLLLKLPGGPYSVAATYRRQTQTRAILAGNGVSAPVVFEWK